MAMWSLGLPFFSSSYTNTLTYHNVATGINATIVAQTGLDPLDYTEYPLNAGGVDLSLRNGSVNGDARISQPATSVVEYSLTLWDATIGTGFDTVYDPVGGFEWDLTVYDIDSNNNNRDLFTLLTDADYSVTADTTLEIVETLDGSGGFVSVSFGTQNPGTSIAGQDGLDAFITEAQKNASVGIHLIDAAVVEFVYEVELYDGRRSFGGRALPLDGSGLFNTAVAPVPAALPLMLGGIGGIGVLAAIARRTSKRASTDALAATEAIGKNFLAPWGDLSRTRSLVPRLHMAHLQKFGPHGPPAPTIGQWARSGIKSGSAIGG